MSKTFGEHVRMLMGERTNKEIACEVHGQLDDDTLGTIESRLSNLVNGEVRGVRFFFDQDPPLRLNALAMVLGRDVAELRSSLQSCVEQRALVVDPRLTGHRLDLLRAQAERAGVSLVLVAPTDDLQAALRDAATQAENPIVVLAEKADLKIFELLQIPCTLLESVPRGVRLQTFPSLVPPPPHRLPRLFDDKGTPLLPITDPWRPDGRQGSQWQAAIMHQWFEPAAREGEVPCLPLETALRWIERDGGPLQPVWDAERAIRVVVTPKLTAKHFDATGSCDTQVWVHEQRLFAAGPRVEQVRRALAPHHEVHEVEAGRLYLEATRDANPWRLPELAAAAEHPLHLAIEALAAWAKAIGCGSIATALDGSNLDHLTSLSAGRGCGSGTGTSPSA